jgi:membrane associated rhomboid family serine protease
MNVYAILIIAITAVISILAFNNQQLYDKLVLWPRIMRSPEQYYRLLTSGFIHANWPHLAFNMLTLYFFSVVDIGILFPILYLTAIVVSSIPTMIRYRDVSNYRSLGASGGIAAVIFFFIFFFPWAKMYIMFLPFGVPSIIFAVLYLAYSFYMSRAGTDHINHDAHMWGAVYGLAFAFLVDSSHGQTFIHELMNPPPGLFHF